MKVSSLVPFVAFVLFVVPGCQKADRPAPAAPESRPTEMGRGWKRVDAGAAFSFLLPEEMQQQKAKGIDSLVGEYRSSKMRLGFDYGRYSDPLTNYRARPECDEETKTISGKEARIVQCRGVRSDSNYWYLAAVHFSTVHEAEAGQTMKLTMQADFSQEGDLETARKILESIEFK